MIKQIFTHLPECKWLVFLKLNILKLLVEVLIMGSLGNIHIDNIAYSGNNATLVLYFFDNYC